MAKLYRALTGFRFPADPESWKKRKSALKLGPGEKKDALMAQVTWMTVKKGDKLTPYDEDALKSWLDNEVVEEVKASG